MTLVLEVEYLAGVSVASVGLGSRVPDWPPQPDRVFSALVATWAARGQSDDEARALEWLESLPAPRIIQRGAEARTVPTVFVPPNDPRSDRKKNAQGVVPALRSRQPRRFPTVRPSDPVIRVCWLAAAPDAATLTVLDQLARDTAYLGHSSSLTRCRFMLDENANMLESQAPVRSVYPGRLRELREAYARFEKSAHKKDRPQPGAYVTERASERSRANYFGDRWLLLEHVDGVMPDLRGCALVARTIRDAIFSGYERIGLGDRIPEVISGHLPDGAPSRAPHIAIVPLPFAGFRHADGHALGFAVVPPHGSTILGDEVFRKALRTLAPVDEDLGRRVLVVRPREGTPPDQAFSIALSPSFEAGRQSLDPARYVGQARTFASMTPVVLDRHLKEKGDARQREIKEQVSSACRNIGLPEPHDVVADKHSAIEGAPSAYPSGKSPPWLQWRMPPSLASRRLTHCVIRFSEPVDGPVILGAGRFLGLGLCLPLDREG